MAQPNQNNVHVNAILTQISTAYIQDAANFIASRVFPVIPVDKQSDLYFTYNKGDWFRDEAKQRAGGTESAGSGYGISTDSYAAKVYAMHKDVDDQTLANADNPLNLHMDATRFVTQRLLLRQEVQWASDYFATGKWGTDMTGQSASGPDSTHFVQWDQYATSDPINDVEVGRDTIQQNTGFEANTLVLGRKVWRVLKNHPQIRDRIKYTSAENTTPQMLASLFEVDNVYVANAIQNTAHEGQTAAMARVFGNHVLLCHSAPNPGLLVPTAGYIFHWTGVSGGLGTDVGISQFRMEHLKADRVEGEMAWANKKVGADLGYFLYNATA